MKKVITIIAIVALFSSCKALRGVESLTETQAYGNSCEHPTYIATISKDADMVSGVYASGTLRLSSLVKEAQTKYGADVTISNVRWDLQNGKRRSVVYDVIKCK